MTGVLRTLALTALVLAATATPAAALGISLPGSAALSSLAPGQTATSAGLSVSVTGVLLPWSLTVAPQATATPGRLRAGTTGCTGSPDALQNPLVMKTSSTLGTTVIDKPTYAIQSGTTQVAHGVAVDVLTVSYEQPIGADEALVAGCQYSITLTFTVS